MGIKWNEIVIELNINYWGSKYIFIVTTYVKN